MVETHKRQLAIGIVDDFKGHSHQRPLSIRLEVECFVRLIPLLGKYFPLQWAWQIAHHCVEQWLHTLIFVGRSTENRRGVEILHGLLHDRVNLVLRHCLLAEKFFHQRVGIHGQRLKHGMPRLGGFDQQRRRNAVSSHDFPVLTIKVNRLHSNQIDHAFKLIFLTDWDLHWDRIAAELFLELLDNSHKICAGAIHLIDERQTRNFVTLHLTVDRHRLTLYATHGTEHKNGAIEHAQAAFHLDGKIHVAGRVDQVDVAVAPFHTGGSAGNGDAAFAFQIHVIHGGTVAAALDFLNAMDASGVKENPLRKRRFTGVDVG